MKMCQVLLEARSQFRGLILKYIPLIASSSEDSNLLETKLGKKVTTMSDAE